MGILEVFDTEFLVQIWVGLEVNNRNPVDLDSEDSLEDLVDNNRKGHCLNLATNEQKFFNQTEHRLRPKLYSCALNDI